MTQGNAHHLVLLGFKMEFSGFPDGLLKPKSGKSETFHHDGGVSWVFSSCGASVEFLTKYVGELRKPLMWRQGSKLSMHMARGARQCFRVMIGESGLKTR